MWDYIAIIIVILVLIVGWLITYKETQKGAWYDTLVKSKFNPPKIVFPIVWTILYAFIAIAWVYSSLSSTTTGEYAWFNVLFGVNIILNLFWSYVFFNLHNPTVALGICLLLVITALMIVVTANNAVTLSLMIVYLAWLCFAFFLNYQVIALNPSKFSIAL